MIEEIKEGIFDVAFLALLGIVFVVGFFYGAYLRIKRGFQN